VTRIFNSRQFIISVLAILFIIPLIYDIFEFISNTSIPQFQFVSEFFMLTFILLYYHLLTIYIKFSEKPTQEVLKIFVYLLGVLYLSVILARIILSPSFEPGGFPNLPETFGSVIYANLVSLLAILFMTPILLLLRNLIYYKHKRATIFVMRAFLISSFACIVATVITQAPLDFDFSELGVYNNSILIFVLLCTLFLSFRNSWITYLTQREKISYFFISLFLIWAIFYLFEFAFKPAVSAHSLTIGVYAYISWILLVAYTIVSCSYLLLQLPTARIFDRKMREVVSLHDLSRAITTEFNFNKLVKLITEMTTKVIGSDSTWLELSKEGKDGLYIASSHNLSQHELENFPISERQFLSKHILNEKKPLIFNEIPRAHPYEYVKTWKKDIGSIIGVPLISGNGNSLGILFATKKHSYGFDPDDQAMLEAYSNQAVIALDNAQLLKHSFERERLEEELRIARDVQQRLLPQQTPQRPGLSIDALTITAYEVGGDYYDFIDFANNHIGFIIGDVSGKGTSAAFYMAEAKGVIQSLSKSFSSPRDLLIRTNEILYESLEKKTFISMLMATMDCDKKRIVFARAGHCPLLYYNSHEKKSRLLQPEGIGVGMERGLIFETTLVEQTIDCQPGDIFAFYTDGLSEARNKTGEEFGDERLCTIINKNAQKNIDKLKDTIIDEILEFLDGENLADDLTLVLVKT
jgi:sigma-B regulation protein RsbU (phosphoserine phosphatase)